MAPIAKETEVQNSPSSANAANSTQNRVQPVALEIAVTVNGARSVDGTDKREPFSETTQTVLVFGNGAVIRLSSAVAPGQLLFLTNEKTKKEVVCQVVKSKNYRSVSGYVELEFTEPAVGFWGMRFPTDRIGNAPVAPSAPPVAVAPTKPAPAAVVPVAVAPPIAVAPPPAPVTPAPVNVAPVNVAPPADSASEELKKQAARLQEQLSSMLFSEAPAPAQSAPVPPVPPAVISEASTKILEMAKVELPVPQIKADPAPGTRTFQPLNLAPIAQKPAASLHEEAVKIPSWLEPLARNAAAPAPPAAQQSAPQPVLSLPAPSRASRRSRRAGGRRIVRFRQQIRNGRGSPGERGSASAQFWFGTFCQLGTIRGRAGRRWQQEGNLDRGHRRNDSSRRRRRLLVHAAVWPCSRKHYNRCSLAAHFAAGLALANAITIVCPDVRPRKHKIFLGA